MSPANAFVDFVSSVAAAPAAAAAASVGAPPAAAASTTLKQIAFRNGPVGMVDTATPQGSAWLQVLTLLQRNGAPAYVEFDPVNSHVTRVLQPHVVQVVAITGIADGVEVELQISHAKHYLRKSQPDYARLLAALKVALTKKTRVAVTESPVDHEIFEVSALPAGDAGTAPPAAPAAAPGGGLDGPVATAIVPLAQAQRLFELMNAKVCCPAGAAAPCITFGYPDDGCWGRAHEMYRLMAAEGVIADKVWIYGNLRVVTRNNPRCEVRWGWHVAPTLLVDVGGGRSETYVIDPSLFPGPVPRATWAGVQGDPNASLVPSAGTVFHRSSAGGITLDPGYLETNKVLDRYRNELRLRATGADGPPPYLACLPAQAGVQFYGSVAPGATHSWFTFGWPANWHVLWSVMPLTTCPGAAQLNWRTRVERANATQATYWIVVTNTSGATVRFEGRYDVLSR
jgi:hypothetical protein